MTPALFFRVMSWCAALVAILFVVLALLQAASGQGAAALLLGVLAAVNAFGWRTFRAWSRKA